MNYDAQEAALGLLGLCPNNLSPLATTSTIPAKRKQGSNNTIINRDQKYGDKDKGDNSQEDIRCICGYTFDDGFSIACDDCSRWCHAACFDIVEGGVPEEWFCWECLPRLVDSERAARVQRERLKVLQVGSEKKQRRQSVAAIDGGKRRRRLSMVQQPQQQPVVPSEDEHIDIDEPWTHSYVHITQDIVPEDTCIKLRRQAHHWRGITAISDTPLQPVSLPPNSPPPPPTIIKPISSPTNVRPPSYAVHTTSPIPSSQLITPYTSCITPSSLYLSDSLNSYAHLGMPKPFVHLLGPPLDIALDSRITGDRSRFVRNGCRPNAVLRPVLCDQPQGLETLTFGVFSLRDLKANEEVVLGWEWDDGNAVHALPALIETPGMFPLHDVDHLRNQMSNILHALSSTFTTCACGARAKDCVLTQMSAFVDNEVPSTPEPVDLGPLVGRKRGFRTRERIPFSGGMGGVEMVSEAEVEEQGGSPGPLPSFVFSPASPSSKKGKGKATSLNAEVDVVRERSGVDHRQTNQNRKDRRTFHISPHPTPSHPKLEPPTKHPSGLPTELRPPDTMQVGDQELLAEDQMPPKMRKKWIHREFELLREANGHAKVSEPMSIDSSKDPPGVGLGIRTDSEDVDVEMPPPPLPASLDPTTISSQSRSSIVYRNHPPQHQFNASTSAHLRPSTSPTTSFAKLSLLSPMLPGLNSQVQLIQSQQPGEIDHSGQMLGEGWQKDDDQDDEGGPLSIGQRNPPSPPPEQRDYFHHHYHQHPSPSQRRSPSPGQSKQCFSPPKHLTPLHSYLPPSHAPAVQPFGSPTQHWSPFRRLVSPGDEDPPSLVVGSSTSVASQTSAQYNHVAPSPITTTTTLPLSSMRHEATPLSTRPRACLDDIQHQDGEEEVSHVELGEDDHEEANHGEDEDDDDLTLAYPEVDTETSVSPDPATPRPSALSPARIALPDPKWMFGEPSATSTWFPSSIPSAPDSISSTPPAGVYNNFLPSSRCEADLVSSSGTITLPSLGVCEHPVRAPSRSRGGKQDEVVVTHLAQASIKGGKSEEAGGSAGDTSISEDVHMGSPEQESAARTQTEESRSPTHPPQPASPSSQSPLPRPASPSPPADASAPHELTPPPTARSPSHSPMTRPPPVPKVKMSLKDFALRKKKQREEEMLTKYTQASPVAVNLSLVSDGEGETFTGPSKEDRVEVEEVARASEESRSGDGGSNGAEKERRPDEEPAAEPRGAGTTKEEELPPATNVGGALPLANGFHNNLTPSPSQLLSKPPILLPSHTQLPAPPPTREAKQELIEPLITPVRSQPNGKPFSLLDRLKGPYPFHSTPPSKALTQRLSHEDGEIGETSPPPCVNEQPRPVYVPRSVSPPKQPRALMGYPFNTRPMPSSISSTAPVFRNPPPTGPRALRNSMPPRQLAVSPPNIPRGPSADRDRVDWDQRRSHSSRSGHNGWCR